LLSSTGYIAPPDLDRVVRLLADNPRARILAGGHSLLLQANRNGIAGCLLIDLKNIHALSGIELEPDGTLKIGAMSTVRAIATDELIRTQYPALAEAALLIGDAQLRNRATLGGSLALADPEADLPALILALDATIVIKGLQNPHTIPAAEFFTGPRQTVLKSGEVITSVLFRAVPERFGLAYEKFKNPATLYALCGVAASVTLEPGGAIAAARVAATGALDHPMRLQSVEEAVLHKPATDKSVSIAAAHASDGLTFRGDLFASAEYRRHLLQILTRRALQRAISRAST
jgi:aerobic carbon-monoxide dehydrogenase medium subunit